MLGFRRQASTPLDRQVVVVVGATSGIGRASALRFARRGARLVITARDREALDRLADELRTTGSPDVAVLTRIAERMQAGEAPPPPPGLPASGEADNLFAPVPGVETTTGGYGGRTFSLGNRVQMASPATRAAVLVAIAGLGSLAIRRAR